MNPNEKAFPGHPDGPAQKGMSLRDWFAGQALCGMLSNPEVFRDAVETAAGTVSTADDVLAEWAGWQADAMLREREAEK